MLSLLIGGVAHAQPRRLSSSQTPAPKPVAAPVAKKPAAPAKLKAEVVVKEATPPAPTAQALMTHYQRVGRDIMQLQNFRGTECTLELWKTFRTIKIEEATATAQARIATAATLQDIQVKIDRKRGITIRQECLNNPLAPECQL